MGVGYTDPTADDRCFVQGLPFAVGVAIGRGLAVVQPGTVGNRDAVLQGQAGVQSVQCAALCWRRAVSVAGVGQAR